MRPLALISGLALALNAAAANAMEFEAHRNGSNVLILASGDILPGDDAKLHQFVQSLPPGTTLTGITLTSMGGSPFEAVRMATTIRTTGLKTAVIGDGCSAACFVMFAAGSIRLVFDDARVGVQSADGVDTGAPPANGLLARKAAELGVPAAIIGKMVNTPSTRVTWLTRQDLLSMHTQFLRSDDSGDRSGSALQPGGAAPPPPSSNQQASAQTPSFAAGRAARMDYEQWYGSLDGEYKQGAGWWASHRSAGRVTCTTEPHTATWMLGCSGAQRRLEPADQRRRTDADFRAGWNSL
jgi:hypothetical protein